MSTEFFRIKSIILCILVAFPGCTWMGSAKVPKPDIPVQFRSSDASFVPIKDLPYLAWWQSLQDPILNDLIETGLKNNLDIEIALSNLEQAKGLLKQLKLNWIPFVSILGGYSSNPAIGNPGTFISALPQYVLNIPGLIKQQQQAKYNVEIAKAIVDSVRLALIGQISTGYFTLIAQQEQLHLLQILENDLNTFISLQNSLVTIGLKNPIDVAEFIVAEKQVKGQMNIIKNNIVLGQNSLHYLLNQNPGEIKTKNNFAQLDFGIFKPGSLPSTVLQNRPDLLVAENNLQSAHAGVSAAYSDLFPNIQLDHFFGGASGNGTIGAPNKYTQFTDAYLNWNINPSTFGKIDAQKGAYKATVYQYIQTVRKILKDVDNGFSANIQMSENYQNTYSAWKTFKDKYELQNNLYQSGLKSYARLLLDKIELDNLALILNQSKLYFSTTIVNLYQELAGGYKYKRVAKNSQ